MPRAYYKPFTAYEEAVGFHATKRNAYFFCAVFFAGILFKGALMMNYSSVVQSPQMVRELEDNPSYQSMLDRRTELMETLSSQESLKKAMQRRRQAPPA